MTTWQRSGHRHLCTFMHARGEFLNVLRTLTKGSRDCRTIRKNLETETTIFMSHTLLVDWTSQVVLVVKSLSAKASRCKIPESSLLEEGMVTTPVFLPGESHGQRRLAGCKSIGSHRIRHNWSDWANTGWLSPALVISCYAKYHPKLSVWAWQTFTNTISVDQGYGSDLVGKFWLRISHKVAGKYPLGLQASQGLNRIRFISNQSHQLLAALGSLPHEFFHQLTEGSYDTVVVSLSPGLPAA